MAADAKVKALRGVSLFAGLRDRELEQVAKLVDEIDRPAGYVLMREGEQGSQAFVLESGGAKVERDGREIARVVPGEIIGEIALLAEGPRTASATLTEQSHLYVLAHREFHSLLDNVPAVRDCVLTEVARRLRVLEPDKAH